MTNERHAIILGEKEPFYDFATLSKNKNATPESVIFSFGVYAHTGLGIDADTVIEILRRYKFVEPQLKEIERHAIGGMLKHSKMINPNDTIEKQNAEIAEELKYIQILHFAQSALLKLDAKSKDNVESNKAHKASYSPRLEVLRKIQSRAIRKGRIPSILF